MVAPSDIAQSGKLEGEESPSSTRQGGP